VSKGIHQIKIGLITCLALITVIFALGSIFLWTTNYETLTNLVLKTVHKEDWRPYFEERVFPPNRFNTLQYLATLFSLSWTFFAYWFYKKSYYFADVLSGFWQQSCAIIRQQIQQFERQEKIFFLVLLIGFALRGFFQIYRYELQYDEAWTYNHFISNGFLVSAISPNNNHLLYSLFACLFDYLPIAAKYSLRLPVYLGGLATCILFYWMIRSIWKSQWALVALAWFAFSPSICFYSMYARGYIFQIFFTLLATWASLKITTKNTPKSTANPTAKSTADYFWLVWVLANILGFYSVPTYAYIWVLLNVFLCLHLITKNTNWKPWIWSNIFVLLVTSLLYFPFLISNGLNTLVAIASTEAPQGEAFLSYQDKVADWVLLGAGRLTSVYWFWCLLILAVLPIWWKAKSSLIRRTVELILLFLLFPSILNLSLGTQPPYRVWCFLAIFVALIIPLIGSFYASKIKSSAILCFLAILLSSFSIWRTEVHYAIRWSAELDKEVEKIATSLLDNEFSEVYLFSNYDKPLLEYYYLQNQQRLKVFMATPDSKNYAPFVNAPIYEVVLWDKEDRVASPKEQAWLEQYYPNILYEDHRVVLRKAAQ
jgi:cell division protein FtsL